MDSTYKKSLIDTLLFYCFLISLLFCCSDYTLFHLELKNLRDILEKYSYSTGIIEQSIKSFLNKFYVPKKVIPTVSKKELFVVFSILKTMSSNLKQKIKTYFKYSLPQWKTKIILKSTNLLSSCFHFRDVLPKQLQSHIVYKFLWGNCNITYYGKTECLLL